MKTCLKCGHGNTPTEKICIKCGEPLESVKSTTTTIVDDPDQPGSPKWGSARLPDVIYLEVLDTQEKFQFDLRVLDPTKEIEIGRKDPDTGQTPDVDLSNSNGSGLGVSRRHAKILRHETALLLVDNNSANGTYINGQRLVAFQPRVLRDADDIRLGKLVMRATFKYPEKESSNTVPVKS